MSDEATQVLDGALIRLTFINLIKQALDEKMGEDYIWLMLELFGKVERAMQAANTSHYNNLVLSDEVEM